MATKQSRFESSRYWHLGTPGAKCTARLKDNQCDSLKEAIVEVWNKIPQEIMY